MKTVFITGASSGIGKSAAVLFQKNGWNVAAAMRNLEKGEELLGLKNLRGYSMDVTDGDSIRRSVEAAIQDFGRIDVLVNNAGIYSTKPLEVLSDDEVECLVKTNIIGYIHVTKVILPYFRSQKDGMIINISSVAGKSTFPFQSLYHSTKWAIEGLSEGLQHELKKLNIKVKIVEPGMVKTNLYASVKNLSPDSFPKEYHASFGSWHRYLMESFNKGYGPEVTAKTILKAALDHGFRLRYASGMDTKMVFFLRGVLPLSLYNRIVRRLSGI